KLNKTSSHQHSKGNEVQPCQRFRQPFVVTRQPSKSSSPSETALYHPAPGQEYKPSLGVWQLDYFQLYAFPFGSLRCLFSRVASIYISQFNAVSSRFLHLLGQLLYVCPVLLVSRGYVQSQQVSQSVPRQMHLASL